MAILGFSGPKSNWAFPQRKQRPQTCWRLMQLPSATPWLPMTQSNPTDAHGPEYGFAYFPKTVYSRITCALKQSVHAAMTLGDNVPCGLPPRLAPASSDMLSSLIFWAAASPTSPSSYRQRSNSKAQAHRMCILFQLSLKRFHLSPPPRSQAPALWGQALAGSRAPPIASLTIRAAGPAQRVSHGRARLGGSRRVGLPCVLYGNTFVPAPRGAEPSPRPARRARRLRCPQPLPTPPAARPPPRRVLCGASAPAHECFCELSRKPLGGGESAEEWRFIHRKIITTERTDYYTEHDVPQAHPCCSVCQVSLPVKGSSRRQHDSYRMSSSQVWLAFAFQERWCFLASTGPSPLLRDLQPLCSQAGLPSSTESSDCHGFH
ncbi:uncharacterized protein LOC111548598 [Piliocolobus tephrosceles]|uniref:uncharacterized protein LOC111548598 n=1 Tax=Piliocolobus tephrosceles TaxID=591936 RepID=UPI000E6B12CF|nr:uncharacterized protein LOC111548598 [Piliocolobus tephrosceles]